MYCKKTEKKDFIPICTKYNYHRINIIINKKLQLSIFKMNEKTENVMKVEGNPCQSIFKFNNNSIINYQ